MATGNEDLERLRTAIGRRSLAIGTAATACNVSRQTVRSWLRGDHQPYPSHLSALHALLEAADERLRFGVEMPPLRRPVLHRLQVQEARP